jgi:hypothetical protein
MVLQQSLANLHSSRLTRRVHVNTISSQLKLRVITPTPEPRKRLHESRVRLLQPT